MAILFVTDESSRDSLLLSVRSIRTGFRMRTALKSMSLEISIADSLFDCALATDLLLTGT